VFIAIGVYKKNAEKVEKIIEKFSYQPKILIKPEWYY